VKINLDRKSYITNGDTIKTSDNPEREVSDNGKSGNGIVKEVSLYK
jgi:hypothetical protein